MKNKDIEFFTDVFIVDSFLSDGRFTKQAQMGGIIESIKGYVSSHIKPGEEASSVLSILAPMGVTALLAVVGKTWWGLLFGILTSMFHIDVQAIFSSIYDKIKPMIMGGNKVNQTEIESIVTSAVNNGMGSDSEKKASLDKQLRDISLLKVAIENPLVKTSGISKSTVGSLFGKILKTVFIGVLGAGGLLIAGDAVNAVVGRPSAFTGTLEQGKSTMPEPSGQSVQSKQTKFKQKTSYSNTEMNSSSENWIENVTNNKASIEDLVVRFANEVYDGLQSKTADIKSSPAFQAVVYKIQWYNQASSGAPLIFIPKMFSTKKSIVDWFIDDVAKNS